MTTVNQMNPTATNLRSFYARLSALGFGLIALTGLFALVWSLATGDTSQGFVFPLVFIIVGLLVAGAVWRWGRWTLVLAAVLSFALVALIGPFSPFSLSHPESAGISFRLCFCSRARSWALWVQLARSCSGGAEQFARAGRALSGWYWAAC
jgi:hypothetical protein